MSETVFVRGGTLVQHNGQDHFLTDGDLLIENGVITRVGDLDRYQSTASRWRTIDATGKLVMPGLVNAHTHSYSNLFRGMFDRLPLEAWVPYATATTLRRTRREGYVSAMLGCIEHLRTGTTTILDHLGGSLESQIGALEAYRDVGMRVVLAPMVADLAPHKTVPLDLASMERLELLYSKQSVPTSQELAEEIAVLLREYHRPDAAMSIMLGPSGPQRCSEDLLCTCRDLAEEFDTGIHTHLLETSVQKEMAQTAYGGTMVEYLQKLGLLSSRFSGAHGVWCTARDLELLSDSGATLVHNPWSNLTLGSGIAPIGTWHKYGVGRALGTDGANCGGNLSMFRAMNLTATLHRTTDPDVSTWPTPDDVFTMATSGSAHAVQLEDKVGKIEPGYEADLVLLNLASTTYVPPREALTQLVHGEMGTGVETVLIKGRVVMDKHTFEHIDVPALLTESNELVQKILTRNRDLFEIASAQKQTMLELSHTYLRS